MNGPDVSIVTEKGGHRLHLQFEERSWENAAARASHLLRRPRYSGRGGVIDWPVALVIAAGHLVNELTNRPDLQALGQALEAA